MAGHSTRHLALLGATDGLAISVHETVAVAEAATVTVPTIFIAVSDAVSVADVPNVGAQRVASSEAISVADSVGVSLASTARVSEALSVAEAIGRYLGVPAGSAEAIGVSDSVSVSVVTPPFVLNLGVSVSEAIGVLDSPIGAGLAILVSTGPPPATPRNVLIDRLTGEVYPWPINHETEDAIKTLGRQITLSGKSSRILLMRQPVHPGPVHLVLHGSMLDRTQSQYSNFIRFFNECDDRTFDYVDAAGESYHVSLVQFDARRQLAAGRDDGSFLQYTLEMEVVEATHGALVGYAV